jgi:hypothetical protein
MPAKVMSQLKSHQLRTNQYIYILHNSSQICHNCRTIPCYNRAAPWSRAPNCDLTPINHQIIPTCLVTTHRWCANEPTPPPTHCTYSHTHLYTHCAYSRWDIVHTVHIQTLYTHCTHAVHVPVETVLEEEIVDTHAHTLGTFVPLEEMIAKERGA